MLTRTQPLGALREVLHGHELPVGDHALLPAALRLVCAGGEQRLLQRARPAGVLRPWAPAGDSTRYERALS